MNIEKDYVYFVQLVWLYLAHMNIESNDVYTLLN